MFYIALSKLGELHGNLPLTWVSLKWEVMADRMMTKASVRGEGRPDQHDSICAHGKQEGE